MEVLILHKLSDVTLPEDGRESADSIARERSICGNDDRARGQRILLEAQGYYSAMYRFREDRERNKRYNYGDQWGDPIVVDGVKMTEEEYIKKQGNIPLKTNLIRRLTRSVIGVYRSQNMEPTCNARDRAEQQDAESLSTLLQYNMETNRMSELYARSFEEYLIGGMVVHRKWYGWRNGKFDCWTDYVQPNNFFIDNNMRDFRAWDCSFVGEIHDVNYDQVVGQFAHCPGDYQRLSQIYASARDARHNFHLWEDFGYGKDWINVDFLCPHDESRCRVIEVWRKESKPRYRCHDYNTGEVYKIDVEDYAAMVEVENARRMQQGTEAGMNAKDIPFIKAEWFMDEYWYYYYLSPMGDILAEGETPYAHEGHPYVFKAYPFIDGEIHSFVSDVIDQQRYTNRLITLNDWVIRSSAKGVLMIPEDCLNGQDPEDFAEEWTKFNGTIVYKPGKSGNIPTQISSNSTNIGLQDMLAMQLKSFEDISGVNNSLQGKQGYSGTSAALYSQQTQNATMTLLDVLDSFNEFVHDASYKDIKNIQQYYDDNRMEAICGRSVENLHDLECDVSIVQSQSTPAYRAIANDFLMQMFNAKALSIEQLLEAGDFPFADKLLQSIRSQKEQLEQGQVPEGISPELMQQVQQGANPQVQQAMAV